EFLIGNWIELSKQWATNESEKQLYEWNARNLITLWGDRNSKLHDYAQKQWAGMMKDFYYPRWEMLIEQAKVSLQNGKDFDKENYNQKVMEFEETWTKQTKTYNTKPSGNSIQEAKRIYQKYFASNLDK
ncbi:MAG: alpha-N-acetylglucosaminidase C-terminal domain-containing protein, partial [Ignavibacteria bacterium]|nr:alpha-N-acetylglucosaminidase C-terminal domain-containing protein [Ignavibacteria bacterium]